MHYYQFHIGDFRSATLHLSNAEELTYRRLLDWYYDTETPIPLDTQWVSRRLRVGIEDLESVLKDFFSETPEGWVNARCEAEIAGYQGLVEKNRENGKKGGRPRKNKNPVGSQSDASGNPDESQKKPNHEPLTKNQEPEDQKPCPQQAENGHQFRFAEIQETYNRICSPTLPSCRTMTDKRKRQVKRMVDLEFNGKRPFREHGLSMWESYFGDCLTNKHWVGENDRGWRADFDFVTKPDNAIKLLERICG